MRSIATTLIAVLALITLGGLLVVGIIRVREAAARIQCANNLRQIGLSLHDYQAFYGSFPEAAMPNPALPAEGRLSWLVAVVPFVESDNVYARMDKGKGWEAEENRFAALTPRAYLHCPAAPEGVPDSTLVPTFYVGLAGVGADAAALPAGDPRAGFFGYERKLTSKDIRGNEDNLLMAAETARAEGAWTAAGRPTVRGLERGGPPYLGDGGQFGGLHRGGANAVFADASVRFLPRRTAPEVLEALVTLRAGAGPAPAGR